MSQALSYEWRRITTIRSTWVLASCYLLTVVGFAWLTAVVLPAVDLSDAQGNQIPAPRSSLSEVLTVGTNYVSLVFLLTVAAQVFGHEYRYGLIRLTLTAFPRRGQVFVAKAAMLVAVIAGIFLVGVALAWAVALIGGERVEATSIPDVAGSVGRSLLFVLGFALIGFALAAITRNLALGVVIPLVWAAVFEGIIGSLLEGRLPWLGDVLPFRNGSAFAAGDQLPRSGLVFLAWVVAFMAAAWVAFDRRDA